MGNLGVHYSKSIIRKFDYIPVYIPDTKISPGAIISFGTNIFGNAAKPYGAFQVMTHLMDGPSYQFDLPLVKHSSEIEFNFVSENEVEVKTGLDGKFPNIAEGDIEFTFKKEGSILLFGVAPTEQRIEDQFKLQSYLDGVAMDRNWEAYYVVTSVITCKRALVYQSNAKDGKLVVSADAKKIKLAGSALGNLGAKASISVKWKTNQAFSIDWTENVVLFMKLKKFTRMDTKNFASVQMGEEGLLLSGPSEHFPSYLLEDVDLPSLR